MHQGCAQPKAATPYVQPGLIRYAVILAGDQVHVDGRYASAAGPSSLLLQITGSRWPRSNEPTQLGNECHGVDARLSLGHPSEGLRRANDRRNRDRSRVYAGRESLIGFPFSSLCGRYARYLARPEFAARMDYVTTNAILPEVRFTVKQFGWGPACVISLSLRPAEAAHLQWNPKLGARTRQGGQDSNSRGSNGPLGSSLAQRCRTQRCALAGVQLVRPLSLRPSTPAGEHVERSQRNAGYILCKR
jgi:hypothetical protein